MSAVATQAPEVVGNGNGQAGANRGQRRPWEYYGSAPLPGEIRRGTRVKTEVVGSYEFSCGTFRRAEIMHHWPQLQDGNVIVETEGADYIGRLVGVDRDCLYILQPGDVFFLKIPWEDIILVGRVVPADDPQGEPDAASEKVPGKKRRPHPLDEACEPLNEVFSRIDGALAVLRSAERYESYSRFEGEIFIPAMDILCDAKSRLELARNRVLELPVSR